MLAEPITHRLYFKAAQDFTRDHTNHPDLNTLHKLRMDVCTLRGRLLEYKETVGKIVILDYNKSILSRNFNPSKFDFNPWELDAHLGEKEKDPNKTEQEKEKNPGGPTISFLVAYKSIVLGPQRGQIGMRLDPYRAGVPNWSQEDQELEECVEREPRFKSGTPCCTNSNPSLPTLGDGPGLQPPPQPDSVRCQQSLHCRYSGYQ